MTGTPADRPFYEEEHEEFREAAREFTHREVAPHYAAWDAQHLMPRSLWTAAGEAGLLGLAVPEEFGGMGLTDYRFRAVLDEELVRRGALGVALALHLHDDWVLPHLLAHGTDEQKQRWLPPMLTGELVTSVAWTEPDAGSDLRGVRTRAVRDGGDWVLTGQKTFIGNGISGDAALVLARTDGSTGRAAEDGFSLFLVHKADSPGYETGKQLDKMGVRASDTAELFFEDVRVPAANLVGAEGGGLRQIQQALPQGRLAVAVAASAVARSTLESTLRYTGGRTAFGSRVLDFQHTRFELAELTVEVEVTEAYVQRAVHAFNAGALDVVGASKAKYWAGERAKSVTDRCLQLHGGYGYILDYPVAQAYLASRLLTIFGGTSEILRETIGRAVAAEA
ncbi:acyl-CoA dehydrogenase family protein [Kocuria kalidii]|uniref:acyl-CoA dehydrogenase family protein n=1 Tax=Kocuria kalidii TaxID=3376283 RepID=UPI00378C3B31